MAQSLIVQTKQSSVRVSDAFAEVAKIKGAAEENIVRANAQAAQIQAQSKVRSLEKWQGVTERLGKLFANKASEGRIAAGKQKGKDIISKAIETNSFVPRYETEDNILGFNKNKKHDEEANKVIDNYNSLLVANTINSAYTQANSEALVPENRQAVMDNLHGVYGGLIEELEELGNEDLVINARFLAAEKLYALNNDISKKQFAETNEKVKGDFYKHLESAATPTSIGDWEREKAKLELEGQRIADATGTNPLLTRTGQAIVRARNEKAYNLGSQKVVATAIDNIVPVLNEQIDPTSPFILTDDNIKAVGESIADAERQVVEMGIKMGIPLDRDEVKNVRNSIMTGSARLHYENSIDLEMRGLKAGGKFDTQLVEDIMAEEKAKGELVIEEMAGFISDPLERSDWIEEQKGKMNKFVDGQKEALSTYTAKKENARNKAITGPTENSLVPATNAFASANPTELDDDEFKHMAIYDMSKALYGDASGLKPDEGAWELFVANRIEQFGFETGSREAVLYRQMAWKRYNSTIAPFSEIARANGFERQQVVIGVPKMDKSGVMMDENGEVQTTPMVINENGLMNIAKSPDILEDSTRSIISDPLANQEAVDAIRKRNNAVPLNPSSRFAKMSYAIIAGTPYVPEEMDTIDISRNTQFADSIADETNFPLLDSQAYYFMRNLGQRNELQEETEPGAYIDYTDMDKIDLEDSFSGDGVFLPLVNGFEPASEEDFNRIFGDDFDGVVDLIKSDPRAFLSSGQLDDKTAAYIQEELDSFWGSNIVIKPVKHANGFATITYRLYDTETETTLPGAYTIDMRGRR